MNIVLKIIQVLLLGALISGCDHHDESHHSTHSNGDEQQEIAKGPHGGRMLTDGDFALELTIFETGVPPEYRVWATRNNQLISPDQVQLQINLIRLGNKVDSIKFKPQGDFLRGDTEIYEPHSFIVSVEAKYDGNTFTWQYDNFEGRTTILPEIAKIFALETNIAGSETMEENITLYGQIVVNPKNKSEVSARFDGVIQSIHVSLGDTVKKGQILAKVESNESLNTYNIRAPIGGVITEQTANVREQTNGRRLFTITNTSSVWANLNVFPGDRERIRKGATVTVTPSTGGKSYQGVVSYINIMADVYQAVTARVELDNANGLLLPGTHITGYVKVAEYTVPLAVKRSGLQSFRDFTVVYAQIGNEFEVRMLELGRQDDEWIEILGGLEPGTRYVSQNSYLVKADIEKSGASHDH